MREPGQNFNLFKPGTWRKNPHHTTDALSAHGARIDAQEPQTAEDESSTTHAAAQQQPGEAANSENESHKPEAGPATSEYLIARKALALNIQEQLRAKVASVDPKHAHVIELKKLVETIGVSEVQSLLDNGIFTQTEVEWTIPMPGVKDAWKSIKSMRGAVVNELKAGSKLSKKQIQKKFDDATIEYFRVKISKTFASVAPAESAQPAEETSEQAPQSQAEATPFDTFKQAYKKFLDYTVGVITSYISEKDGWWTAGGDLKRRALKGQVNLFNLRDQMPALRGSETYISAEHEFALAFEAYANTTFKRGANGNWSSDDSTKLEYFYLQLVDESSRYIREAVEGGDVHDAETGEAVANAANLRKSRFAAAQDMFEKVVGKRIPKWMRSQLFAATLAALGYTAISIATGGVALTIPAIMWAAGQALVFSSLLAKPLSYLGNGLANINAYFRNRSINKREAGSFSDISKRVRDRRRAEVDRRVLGTALTALGTGTVYANFWDILGSFGIGMPTIDGMVESATGVRPIEQYVQPAIDNAPATLSKGADEAGKFGSWLTDQAGDAARAIDNGTGNNISGFGEFLYDNVVPSRESVDGAINDIAGGAGYEGNFTEDARAWRNRQVAALDDLVTGDTTPEPKKSTDIPRVGQDVR